LEKINVEDIQPSSRKYPAIIFSQARPAGDQILEIKSLTMENEGKSLFKNIDIFVNKGDKIAFVSKDSLAITTFFQVLAGEQEAAPLNLARPLPKLIYPMKMKAISVRMRP